MGGGEGELVANKPRAASVAFRCRDLRVGSQAASAVSVAANAVRGASDCSARSMSRAVWRKCLV